MLLAENPGPPPLVAKFSRPEKPTTSCMNIRTFVALMLALLAVSACVIEPIGGRGYHREGQDYGRGVWRG
jgi:hypothetical protein